MRVMGARVGFPSIVGTFRPSVLPDQCRTDNVGVLLYLHMQVKDGFDLTHDWSTSSMRRAESGNSPLREDDSGSHLSVLNGVPRVRGRRSHAQCQQALPGKFASGQLVPQKKHVYPRLVTRHVPLPRSLQSAQMPPVATMGLRGHNDDEIISKHLRQAILEGQNPGRADGYRLR